MRTIFLTLLLLLALASAGLALDTYSDEAPRPVVAQPESAQPDETAPEAAEGATEADTEAGMEAASEDEIDPDQAPPAPTMTPEEARQASEVDEEFEASEGNTDNGKDEQGYTSVISDNLRLEPLGAVTLRNGTVYEIMDFKKLGKYFIYIAGKLNGRSSTIISLTRLSDLQNWSTIAFKDPYNFTIVDKKKKELFFAESRLYLGTDSPATYTFISVNPNNFQPEVIEVNKKDVKSIVIN
jgi:hypothetical protein